MAEGNIPQPFTTIGCQDLLRDSCTHCGWLRKRSNSRLVKGIMKKAGSLLSWFQKYVVVKDGCVYVYKNESARSPQGAFTLYGYNRLMRAADIPSNEAQWAFKLVHSKMDGKKYYFAAASEVEMKSWMQAMKDEMLEANRDVMKSQGKPSIKRPKEKRISGDGQEEYDTIEEKIYDECDLQDSKMVDTMKDEEDPYCDVKDPPDDNPPDHPAPDPVGFTPPNNPRSRPLPSPGQSKDLIQELKGFNPKPPVHKKPVLPGPKPGMAVPQPPSDKKSHTLPFLDSPAKLRAALRPTDNKSSTLPSRTFQRPPEAMPGTPEYYEAAYWAGSDKEQASAALRKIGQDGVFLVRDGEGNSKTLVLYIQGNIKKYRISQQRGLCFITSGDEFENIEELLYHYTQSNLPTIAIKLKKPYKYAS